MSAAFLQDDPSLPMGCTIEQINGEPSRATCPDCGGWMPCDCDEDKEPDPDPAPGKTEEDPEGL